jgi:hypothetical protein
MADLLVQRVVHPGLAETATASSPTGSRLPVMVNVIVRDSVLFGTRTAPAGSRATARSPAT